MKLSITILEDSPNGSQLLQSFVHKLPNVQFEGAFHDLEALEAIHKQQPVQLLLLDLSGDKLYLLPDTQGFIVCCKNEQLAIPALEAGASDVIKKPLSFERLSTAVDKVRSWIAFNDWQQKSPEGFFQPNQNPEFFFVKADYKIVKINVKDIVFIEGMSEYVRIFTENERIVSLLSLRKLSEILPQNTFTRIHRSHIINLEKVNFIQGNVVSIGGQQLAISKGQRKSFLSLINKEGLF